MCWELNCGLCKQWFNYQDLTFRPDLFENPSPFQNCEVCLACDQSQFVVKVPELILDVKKVQQLDKLS